MPVVTRSTYRCPVLFTNPHVQTVWAGMVRPVPGVRYRRERIATFDDDFLDLDWSAAGRRRLAIVCHGLEGHSRRPYVRGMIRTANGYGWDGLAMNLRHCTEEPNRKPHAYHSGMTQDLEAVVDHVLGHYDYDEIALIGFSLGGNLVLKYLGERGGEVAKAVRCGVGISVPCDLEAASLRIGAPDNRFYMKRFLKMLRAKLEVKASMFPRVISLEDFDSIRDFKDFDDRYTAPLNGFRDALDYWRRCSCKPDLPRLRVPTLLINALDDPFLAPECYPYREAMETPFLFLETPNHGGHVGFVSFNRWNRYWSEQRVFGFAGLVLSGSIGAEAE